MSWARLLPAATVSRADYTSGQRVIDVTALEFQWAWGAQPAEAMLEYAATIVEPGGSMRTVAPVAVGCFCQLEVGNGANAYVFTGVCVADQSIDSSSGKARRLTFRDLREFLSWDVVFGAFNQPEDMLVPTVNGPMRRRRWRHLLPANWSQHLLTWTDTPYTAREIVEFLLGAPTVESPWLAQGPEYHPAMATIPVLDLDFSSGVELGSALTQVSERLGMVFTLSGLYRLRWRRKGELLTVSTIHSPADPPMPWAVSPFPEDGAGFLFPTHNGQPSSDDNREGWQVSGNPTRAIVVGERNLYQVLNLELVKDWAEGWELFWDESLFLEWVYQHLPYDPVNFPGRTFAQYPLDHPDDPENIVGWQLASARAGQLIVQDVINLRQSIHGDGLAFVDGRLFGGQTRLAMPAVLYIRNVLWRAYRLPDVVLGRPAASWTLMDRGLIGVSHDRFGRMTPVYAQPADGNGYAIVQGYGFSTQGAFRALNPDRFNLAEWVDSNAAWSPLTFSIDADGGDGVGFIVFESPVVYAADAYAEVATGAKVLTVPKARPALSAARVRAALTLAGERYRFLWPDVAPSQQRDAALTEPALHHQYIADADLGGILTFINFADGETVDQKAQAIAESFLVRQWVYRQGGFSRILMPGDIGVALNGMIDRVALSVGPGGVTEQVDFTSERGANWFQPERRYDRELIQEDLYPGQQELRARVRETQALASALQANPALVRTLSEAFHANLGGLPTVPAKVVDGAGTLAVGTPLWRGVDGTAAVSPGDTVADEHPVLVGVVSREGEPVGANLPVVQQGRVLVRVWGGDGGVSPGDALGMREGTDTLGPGSSLPVAVARDAVPAGEVRLIWCDVGSGTGGGGGLFCGTIPDPFDEERVLCINSYDASRVVEGRFRLDLGSTKVTLKIGGVPVGGITDAAVALSGQDYSFAVLSHGQWPAGSTLSLAMGDTSADAENLHFNLKFA